MNGEKKPVKEAHNNNKKRIRPAGGEEGRKVSPSEGKNKKGAGHCRQNAKSQLSLKVPSGLVGCYRLVRPAKTKGDGQKWEDVIFFKGAANSPLSASPKEN